MSITAAQGFLAAGVAAGIKASGRLDLALVRCWPDLTRARLQRLLDEGGDVESSYQSYWQDFETGFWEAEVSAAAICLLSSYLPCRPSTRARF